jgi:hypothetical protein
MAAGLPCHTALEFFQKNPPLSELCSSSIRVDLPSFAGYFPPSALRFFLPLRVPASPRRVNPAVLKKTTNHAKKSYFSLHEIDHAITK